MHSRCKITISNPHQDSYSKIEPFLPLQSKTSMLKRFRNAFSSWFRTKLVDPLVLILRRGAEPKQLAFSASLGITLGLFPICGVTVFLCGIAIAVLGSHCHAPTVMLANFIATPIELSLIVPFLRFGEFITGGPHFPLSSDALKKVFTGQASKEVLHSTFHALLGWFVAAPFIMGGLYLLSLPCFKILVRKFGGAAAVPGSPRMPINNSISSPRKSPHSPSEIRLKVRDA